MKIRTYLLPLLFMGVTLSAWGLQKTHIDSLHLSVAHSKTLIDNEYYNTAITLLKNNLTSYKSCVDCQKKDSNQNLQIEILHLLGYAYYHIANYEEALSQFYYILKIPDINDYTQIKAYLGLSNIFFAKKNTEEAKKHLDNALRINENKLKDPSAYLAIYNNIATVYIRQEKYDSSLLFLYKAQDMALISRDSLQPSILINIANIYQMTGRYEQSEDYYNQAIKLSQKINNRFSECTSRISLGVLLVKIGKQKEAFSQFKQCATIAEEIGAKQLLINIYIQLSKHYEREKDYFSALTYARKHATIFDSVYNSDNKQTTKRLMTDFEMYQLETQHQLLERDLTISNAQLFRKNIILGLLATCTLIALSFAIYSISHLIRRSKAYKSLHEQLSGIQSIADTEKANLVKHFETELEIKHNELTTHALLLIKSESVANDLLEKLSDLRTEYLNDEKILNRINDMKHTVKKLNIGKGWEEFRYCFEQVNTHFYENLNLLYPNLTPSDLRFAALLSLNMTTKEIAILTNRSVRGVETSKFRLKKKMKLGCEESLVAVLLHLKQNTPNNQ